MTIQTLPIPENDRLEPSAEAADGLFCQLQSDELVDCELPPQTAASIRIVLGMLSAFSHETRKEMK